MLDTTGEKDEIERLTRNGAPRARLLAVQFRFGLSCAAYIDLSDNGRPFRLHHLHHTFPAQWEATYIERGYFLVDPVFLAVRDSVVPVDWREAAADRAAKDFLAEAERQGVPRDGIALPLISRRGRIALFTCGTSEPAGRWRARRAEILPELNLLAARFHAAIQAGECARDTGDGRPELTAREVEVVKWVAAGKSYWEIAVILGITERTVRFFMTNVREKLDAASNSQAVARAIAMRIVVIG